MKKFLKKISVFLVFFLVATTVLVILTSSLANYAFDFKIAKEKNILILGNSHPECAIDDNLVARTFNLAQSGSGYFYDYLKLKKITTKNVQVDTVILGYSYEDISESMDVWFSGGDRIDHKIKDHFFLFSFQDYFALLKSNPKDVLVATPQTIIHNIKMISAGYSNLGGYKFLERDKLKEAIAIQAENQKPNGRIEISKYQTKYLQKIYNYCETNRIQLVLLNTPMHPLKENFEEPLKKTYYDFARNKLPNALLINHSNFTIPDNYFGDLGHLNHKGAKVYSEYLNSGGLKETLQQQPQEYTKHNEK